MRSRAFGDYLAAVDAEEAAARHIADFDVPMAA
jgi:hypothetical protein